MEVGIAAARRAVQCLVLLTGVLGLPMLAFDATADVATRLEGPRLLAALRDGGHILYFRHTSTDFGQSDERMSGYEDCGLQRNLTDTGRDEARAIGRTIAALSIPVGNVLASPFCRTLETAHLMFGRATPTPAVRGGPASDAGDRYRDLRRLLATPVGRGANVVIVSHGNPFRAITDAPYLAEGEAAVIDGDGRGAFRVIARIRKDGWEQLATP
ncbi:MAG: histidine phosphatase family protein [Casimicrobiaceae bacterium]